MPHKSIGDGGSGLSSSGGAALSASTPSSSVAASSAAQDTPRSSIATDGQDTAESAQQSSVAQAQAEALSAAAAAAADAAAAVADAPGLATAPALADGQTLQPSQQQQGDAVQPPASFDIWPDTEDVLRQMVSWLAGLETGVCQGRIATEPAAARSRSYLSVHKVAALLAGEQEEFTDFEQPMKAHGTRNA